MTQPNPYEIDPLAAPLRRLGATKGMAIYLVETEDLTGVAACNFRRELADFAFEEFEGDFHIGHDEEYAKNLGDNFVLAIRDQRDEARLRLKFVVR